MQRKNILTYKRRTVTISSGIQNGEQSPDRTVSSVGELLPIHKRFSKMLLTEIIIHNPEILEVEYFSQREKITLPKWHCKKCHYSWFPDSEEPPKRCANIHGYVDDQGKEIPKCSTRTWCDWPDDFDPENIATCSRCLYIYHKQRLEKEETRQATLMAVNE